MPAMPVLAPSAKTAEFAQAAKAAQAAPVASRPPGPSEVLPPAVMPAAPQALPGAVPREVPGNAAAVAVAVYAAMLSEHRAQGAAKAAVCELAQHSQVQRASLALVQPDGSLKLVAVSNAAELVDAAASTPLSEQRRLLAALAEAHDQCAVLRWPPIASAAPGLGYISPVGKTTGQPPDATNPGPWVDWAQRDLAGDSRAVISLPLVANGAALGALGLECPLNQAAALPSAAMLGHLAGLMAPLLALQLENERSSWRRACAAVHRWRLAPDTAAARQRRQWATAAAVLGLLLLGWPVDESVGGRARLEGRVQRVLAAPADGFVQQVHARPGDQVKAGQPLLDLAEQDLQLERQRWQSQLAQHLDALATAQARADRSQLVLHQSRADEAQAELDLVDQKLQRSRLLAPFDAVVLQGDWSQQLGSPVKLGATLMTLAPQSGYRVIIEVDERDIAQVQAGQVGSLGLSAMPWDTQALRLTRITPVASAVEGRNVFEVEARLLAETEGDVGAGSASSAGAGAGAGAGSMVANRAANQGSAQGSAQGLRPGLQGTASIVTGRAPRAQQWWRQASATLRRLWWEWLG